MNSDEVDIWDDWCDAEGCEAAASMVVEVSERQASDGRKNYCLSHYETYLLGFQHGHFTSAKPGAKKYVVIVAENPSHRHDYDDPQVYGPFDDPLEAAKLRNRIGNSLPSYFDVDVLPLTAPLPTETGDSGE